MIMKTSKSTSIIDKFAEAVEDRKTYSETEALKDLYVQKIAEGFKADEAPVGRILAAAEQRTSLLPVEEKPAYKALGLTFKRVRTHRFVRRMAVMASVFAIIALALVAVRPAPKPTARAVILKALAAVEPGTGMLYIKAVNSIAFKGSQQIVTTESWLDYKKNRFRQLTSSAKGKLIEDEV